MVGDIISERVGDFKSEWWARSSRNPGRHRSESAPSWVKWGTGSIGCWMRPV